MKYIVFTFVFVVLFLCSCRNNKAANEREQSEACFDSAEREQSRPKVKADVAQSSDAQTEDTLRTITEDMAYEGVWRKSRPSMSRRNQVQLICLII